MYRTGCKVFVQSKFAVLYTVHLRMTLYYTFQSQEFFEYSYMNLGTTSNAGVRPEFGMQWSSRNGQRSDTKLSTGGQLCLDE